jgi:hypothetical protein
MLRRLLLAVSLVSVSDAVAFLYSSDVPVKRKRNPIPQAAEFRRWDHSSDCQGEYNILSTDNLNECTQYTVPAVASILVVQMNSTAYVSYQYPTGIADCTGAKRTLEFVGVVGVCSGDLGGYSQMRVWLFNSTRHCSPGCECCPCPPSQPGCKGACPSCGAAVCECKK